jgi:hypothetical protein
MRTISWLLAAAATLAVACGGGESGAPATADDKETAVPGATPPGTTATASTTALPGSPSPTATTPLPSPTIQVTSGSDPVDPAAFATRLGDALANGNANFIGERLVPVQVKCTAADLTPVAGANSACRAADDAFAGFPSSTWRSGGVTGRIENTVLFWGRVVRNQRATERDQYGAGIVRVFFFAPAAGEPALTSFILTAITTTTDEAPRRVAIELVGRYCRAACANGVANRWNFVRQTTNFVLANEWLPPSGDAITRFGTPLTLLGASDQGLLTAAANAASAVVPVDQVYPNCTNADRSCIEPAPSNGALNLGIAALGYRPARNEPGGAALFSGRKLDGSWGYWFGTQNTNHRLTLLPGELRVCADGDGLNIRERPDTSAAILAKLNDGTTMTAIQFVLTEPGTRDAAGAGWYRVVVTEPAVTGWVFSRFTSTTALPDCSTRDILER